MGNVEVRKVNNGYVVLPIWNANTAHQTTDWKDINVFETFEALAAFLKNHFEVTRA